VSTRARPASSCPLSWRSPHRSHCFCRLSPTAYPTNARSSSRSPSPWLRAGWDWPWLPDRAPGGGRCSSGSVAAHFPWPWRCRLRARTAATTTSLSAFAQSAGYVLAVAGPLTVGALHQFTGGWNAPLVLLLVLLGPQLIAGLIAGQGRAIDDLPGPRQLVGKALRPVPAAESGTIGSRRSAVRR
jgi:hypothetical protein